MPLGRRGFAAVLVTVLLGFVTGPVQICREAKAHPVRSIMASDTILSGMLSSLLPPSRYFVDVILPPGQCPGHYDVKLSDIEKVKKADLVVSFKGMPFMAKAEGAKKDHVQVDSEGRNWMAPGTYIRGLDALARELSHRFPEDREEIMKRKEETVRRVKTHANALIEKIKRAGLHGKAIVASSMQKEPLEWMGFRVVGEYGRPESMSTKELVHLSRIGKDEQAVAVVDNLQSGPEAGKGIAETLGVPHVVVTNFPSEKGYLATLSENVDAVLSAVAGK